MVNLRQVPHTELERNLVFHIHDKGEVLDKLRSYFLATEQAKPSEVEVREPVHGPELDHEGAVHLLLDFQEELLLYRVAKPIQSSHLGELQAVLHVLKRALE